MVQVVYYCTLICFKVYRKTITSLHQFIIFLLKETFRNLNDITLWYLMVGCLQTEPNGGMNLKMHYVLCLSIFSFSKFYNFLGWESLDGTIYNWWWKMQSAQRSIPRLSPKDCPCVLFFVIEELTQSRSWKSLKPCTGYELSPIYNWFIVKSVQHLRPFCSQCEWTDLTLSNFSRGILFLSHAHS